MAIVALCASSRPGRSTGIHEMCESALVPRGLVDFDNTVICLTGASLIPNNSMLSRLVIVVYQFSMFTDCEQWTALRCIAERDCWQLLLQGWRLRAPVANTWAQADVVSKREHGLRLGSGVACIYACIQVLCPTVAV